MYSSLKERIRHVYLTPNAAFATIGEDLVDTGEGVHVGNGVVIEQSIIVDPTRVRGRVGFRNEETR